MKLHTAGRTDPHVGHQEDGNLVQMLHQVVDAPGDGLPLGSVEVLATPSGVVVPGRMGQTEPPQSGQAGTLRGVGDEEKVPSLPVPSGGRLLSHPGAVDQQFRFDGPGQVQPTAHPTSRRQHLLGAQSSRHGASPYSVNSTSSRFIPSGSRTKNIRARWSINSVLKS